MSDINTIILLTVNPTFLVCFIYKAQQLVNQKPMVTWIGSYPTQAYQVDKKRGLIHHPSLLRKEKLLTYAIKNHAILKVKLPGVVCFDVSWYWFIKLDNKCKVGLSTYKTKNKKIEI